MSALDTVSFDIASLSAGYASRKFAPADIVSEVFRRIAAKGERPDWITLASRDEVLAKAEAAPRGPLYGIPFAVKDNIDVAGLPTTCACPEFARTPVRSATVIERLEAAGALPIGKTNLDQFATGLVGTRSPYGIPASVFDAEYISGGSSSGSAVAVAGGLVSFSLGTDTAGSGRVPAAFGNIVGVKPTKGLVSTRGVFPACRTQDCVSIFALTAGDGARVLAVASGFDGEDAYSREAPRSIAVEPVTENVRIGVARDGLTFFGDRQAEAAYRASVARLSAGGARVVEIDAAPFIAGGQLLYAGPWVAERLAALRPFLAEHPDALHEVVAGIVRGAEAIGAAAAFDGFYALADLIREADAQWREMDVLLLPTAGTTYRIDDVLADPVQLNSNLGRYTNFVNLMDLSALAVPAGFRSDGLPFGVTLIGRAFEDGRLLALGDLLHRSVPGARLGATATALSATPPVEAERAPDKVQIAVVGAHLTGQPLNNQLVERKAQLLRTARTASGYSFYALANTTPAKPGLVFDGTGDGNIEVEVWEMETAAFGSFVALVPQPLAIGTVKLANETTVKGFLCEAHAVRDAIDITAYGGWRAWLAQTA